MVERDIEAGSVVVQPLLEISSTSHAPEPAARPRRSADELPVDNAHSCEATVLRKQHLTAFRRLQVARLLRRPLDDVTLSFSREDEFQEFRPRPVQLRRQRFAGLLLLPDDFCLCDIRHQTQRESAHAATEAGQATDPREFHMKVNARASKMADYIVALAKSKMLDDFGEHETADAVIKPHFLESLDGERTT